MNEKNSPFPKKENLWQLSLYAICLLFTMWDIIAQSYHLYFDGFFSYSAFFLRLAIPLLCISLVLSMKSSRWAARCALITATLSLAFYLGIGFTHIPDYPYDIFDISRFYFPRILSFGVALVYSQRILQTPNEQMENLIPIFFFKIHWTPKKQKYLIVALVILTSILCVEWLYPRASCVITKGTWIRNGGILGQAQYCLYSYPDAGKTCKSSADCIGACVLEDYSPYLQPVPSEGVCASNNDGFGCIDYFEYPNVFSVCTD